MTAARGVGVAQTVPVAADVAANVREHVRLAAMAAASRVTLLVFPELSLTGYELASGAALAFEPEDARLRPLIDAADLHGMTLVVGAPVRLSSGLHIGAFIVTPGGGVQLYTKHHLGAFRPEDHVDGPVPPPENEFFSPGTLNPMLPWQGLTLAVSICADSAYPAHTQAAAERGATIYASSQFAIRAHMAFKLSRLKAAARRHGLTVLFSNYGGPTGGLASGGGSCIRASDGSAVARLPAEGRGLAIAWQEGSQWVGEATLAG